MDTHVRPTDSSRRAAAFALLGALLLTDCSSDEDARKPWLTDGASGTGGKSAGSAGATPKGGSASGGKAAGGAVSGGSAGENAAGNAGNAGNAGSAGASGGAAGTTSGGAAGTTSGGAAGTTSGGAAGASASGTPSCGKAGVVSGDVFDPDEVYLFGTLQEGACFRTVVAHWSTPGVGVAGFTCEASGDRADLSAAGRLVYEDAGASGTAGGLFEFRCDGACTLKNANAAYPPSPRANDVQLVPGSVCTASAMRPMLAIDGSLHLRCGSSPDLRDTTGTVVYQGTSDAPFRVGATHILTQKSVVERTTGKKTAITPAFPLNAKIVTTRARMVGGFQVVTGLAIDAPDALTLWEVTNDGVATKVGDLPPLPAGLTGEPQFAKLDGCGNVFHFARSAGSTDLIVRRTVGGATTIVYDESTQPVVQIHISYLLTGP